MALTRVQYLRLATGLPVVVPIVVPVAGGLLLQIAADVGHLRAPHWVYELIGLIYEPLFYAQIYIVLIGVILLLLMKQSWRTHAIGIVLLPCLMIPAIGAFNVITGPQALTLWEAMQSIAAPCLEIGYAYVALAFAGLWILSRTHRIKA